MFRIEGNYPLNETRKIQDCTGICEIFDFSVPPDA